MTIPGILPVLGSLSVDGKTFASWNEVHAPGGKRFTTEVTGELNVAGTFYPHTCVTPCRRRTYSRLLPTIGSVMPEAPGECLAGFATT